LNSNVLIEAVRAGDTKVFDEHKSCISNGNAAEACITALIEYCRNQISSTVVAEYFIREITTILPKGCELIESEFVPYFIQQFDFSYAYALPEGYEERIHKELIPVLVDIGIDKLFVTELLCKYLYRYSLDIGLSGFDESFIEYLISNDAELNTPVVVEQDEAPLCVMASLMKYGLELELQDLFSVLTLLVKNGGDPRFAIEQEGARGGYLYKAIQYGIDISLKPNELGRDGDTDTTRELSDLWFYLISSEEIVQSLVMLKKAGADFNIPNYEGNYPINLAIGSAVHDSQCGTIPESPKEDKLSLAILDFLLKSGSSVMVENADKQTVLMQAIPSVKTQSTSKEGIEQAKRVINLLVEYGALVSQRSSEGLTAFHVAAVQCSKLIPFLRRHNNRQPEDMVEAILFLGPKSLSVLESFLVSASDAMIRRSLAYVCRLKYVDILSLILTQEVDVIRAIDEFKTIEQTKSNFRTYPLTLLNFFVKCGHLKLEVVWREVLEIDTRDKAKTIALQQLEQIVGEGEAALLVDKADKQAGKAKTDFKQRTKEFTKKLKQLRSYLLGQGVFAFDIYNHGYAPSEGGEYVLEAIDAALVSEEITPDDIKELKCCWYDLQHAKDETKKDPFVFVPMLEAVDSIYIYYDGESSKIREKAAATILEAAKHVGLDVKWNGDTAKAILLKLAC